MALSADTARRYRGDWAVQSFVMGTDVIYKGAGVCENTAGVVVAAADTASYRFVGFAAEQVDNSAGTSGVNIKVNIAKGDSRVRIGGTFVQTDVGEVCYVTDDDSVGTPGTDPGNTIVVGRLIELDSATESWVSVQPFGVNA